MTGVESTGILLRQTLGSVSPTLVNWLLAGDEYPCASRSRVFLYWWGSRIFNFNLKMQERLSPALPVGDDPLLVLGAWRSGTTYLHELLASSSMFCTPRTWQCMAPSTFWLTGEPKVSISQVRPMDDFTVSSDSPQEDEFALLALGAPSLYRAFLDPSRLDELSPLLESASWVGAWDHEADWLQFLGRTRVLAGDLSKRLLLKSPNHSYRLPALMRLFPAMQGVWITRSPESIWQSNRRMWAAMVKLYGLARLNEDALDRFLVKVIDSTARALDEWCAALPNGRLVVISFDELVTNPILTTQMAMARLGIHSQSDDASTLLGVAVQKRSNVRHATDRGERPAPVQSLQSRGLSTAFKRLAEAQERAALSHGLSSIPC
jgi:omega-hydroxy-beta-dihydromenaquinone-9 sulfotransferase